jgi:sulfhydrogenase subunit beta (sulfur reductase)
VGGRSIGRDRERALELQRNAQSMLGEPVDLAPLVERLDTMWESPFWEEIAQKCLNCAICSYLCPTCHCFDIQDEGNERTGRRIRIWDSCMFPLFTREASGHNPRANGADRVRQRVMHKFNYFVENLGEYGCVGCGRCVRECPVNVDIREVLTGALQYPVPAKK